MKMLITTATKVRSFDTEGLPVLPPAEKACRLYVGIRVEVRQHGVSTAKVESLGIIFTPGYCITNLMPWSLYVEPSTSGSSSDSFQV